MFSVHDYWPTHAIGRDRRPAHRALEPSDWALLTVDPVAAPVGEGYGAAHVYVRDNPVNLTDPSGRSPDQPVPDVIRQECDTTLEVAQLGFGIGLVVGGAAVDVASALAEVVSGGVLTPAAAAGLMSGTSSIVSGLYLVQTACTSRPPT